MDKITKRVEKEISSTGLRVTPARTAVLGMLQTFRKPLTVTEIIGLLPKKPFDQATIYRTLSSLEKKGLVKGLQIRAATTSYEAQNLPHHHHVTCIECGYVEDVQGCEVEDLDAGTIESFSQIQGHTLEFQGICAQCAAI